MLKYNHQRQYIATSSSQALDTESGISYTCWYWPVKRTQADMLPSQCCALPPPPPFPCLTSSSPPHKGRGCSARWWHWLMALSQQFLLPSLFSCPAGVIHRWCNQRWCNHFRLPPCQAPVGDADCSQSLPPQNYCENFIESLLSGCAGRWITLVKLQAWRHFLLGCHLENDLLVRSFPQSLKINETYINLIKKEGISLRLNISPNHFVSLNFEDKQTL